MLTLVGIEHELRKDALTEAIRETTIYMEDDLKKKLPKEYHDLIDVFDKEKAKELPPH